MEGCDVELVNKIRRLPPKKVSALLQNESKKLLLTKSLLNLVYNAVVVGSIPVSRIQRQILDENKSIVWQFLSPKSSLAWKKRLLVKNPNLALTIATLCPESGL